MENLRRQYTQCGLKESDLCGCPFEQFRLWFEDAQHRIKDDFFEPNAMALATSNKKGEVSNRVVLLKGFDEKGFRFFTNYESSKAKDLEENPNGSLLFYWPQIERQIRIAGGVVKTDRAVSRQYFDSRPRESRISAVISPQSRPVENRQVLEEAAAKESEQVSGGEIELPDYWGGYRVTPTLFEFWQGRENRLHDRLQYTSCDGRWEIQRLGP